mgnify:CR=1 FL=1
MKANQTEGKRHSWKEKGKKILSPALLCLCAVMLLVWAVQLLFFEDAYRFIKSWKLEDVMEQVCEHLDKEHLPQIVEELRLDNIDIRVIDAQGNDWVKNDAETCRILTGYTRQELAELYQQASARGETDIKQVTHVKMVYGDADKIGRASCRERVILPGAHLFGSHPFADRCFGHPYTAVGTLHPAVTGGNLCCFFLPSLHLRQSSPDAAMCRLYGAGGNHRPLSRAGLL